MRNVITLLAIILLVLVTAAPSSAANATALARFDAADVAVGTLRSYQTVSIEGLGTMSAVGSPELPVRVLRFVIPADASVEEVVVGHAFEEELPGTYMLAPKQPEAPIGETVEWVGPDTAVYETPGLYPSERVTYLGDGYLGGYRIASVAVYPLQYEPTTGRLVAATDVSVELVLGAGADRSTRRSRVTPRSDELYRSLVEGLVENPEDVLSCRGSVEVIGELGVEGYSPRYTPSLDGSPVEYLIVTSEELEPYFEPFAEWKTQKGVPAAIRTVSWIEANYPGGCDTAERIRLFLKDAYASWGTTYVLLGGDTQIVPVRYATSTYYSGARIAADLYYSDLDGDWNGDGDWLFGEGYVSGVAPGDSLDLYPDVFVGRAAVTNVVETQTYVGKTLAYERQPAPASADRNLYLAEVLFPYDWEPGDFISTDGAEHVVEPTLPLVPARIHRARLYQNRSAFPGSHELNRTAATDSLNRGYNIVSHVGHGNKDILRVGADNYLSIPDVDALSNGTDRAGLAWMLDCTSAAVQYDCIAEHLLNNPAGGSAFVFGPTELTFPSTVAEFYAEWFGLLYGDATPHAGAVSAMCKAPFVATSVYDNTDRWTQMSYLLLGDPESALWTARPGTLSVSHEPIVELGPATLSFTVLDPSPVVGATVALVKAGEVYATGTTDASGQTTVEATPRTTGSMTVTVTAHDRLPHEGSITVAPTSAPHVTLRSHSVDDTGGGANGNGRAEAGETVAVSLTAGNGGQSAALGLSAALSTSDAHAFVHADSAWIGDLDALSELEVAGAFTIEFAGDCPDEHDAVLQVAFADSASNEWTAELVVRCYRPRPRIEALTIDDGDDGVAEPGETFTLSFDVRNEGNGDLDGLTGTLAGRPGEAVLTDSTDSWGDVQSSAVVSGQTGFVATLLDTLTGRLRLALADEHGKTWTAFVELTPPPAPASPSGEADGTTIRLSWEPVQAADLRGYNIYRSLDYPLVYERANDGIIEGGSFFEDSGLLEKTVYSYTIAAVDSSGNESTRSEPLEISTNPPGQPGWPLPGGEAIYGTPLVADIDLDGDLEVIVGSKDLYCWHHDGVEYLDGDGDPRTNGVYAADGTGGYRSSPALGELDGDAHPEIVAAAWGNVGTETDPEYEVYAWNAEDATVLPGWPVTTRRFAWATPALADVDSDGLHDVVLPCADGNLYCWSSDGAELLDGDGDPSTTGVFARLGASWAYGSPVVADYDDDGSMEILVASRAESVYRFEGSGERCPGWPVGVQGDAVASPCSGDVDGDGSLETAVATNDGLVYLLTSDGSVAPGWPKAADITGDFPPSPVLADIDGDADLEVIQAGVLDGLVRVWDHHGNSLSGWPATMESGSHSSPAVGDVDGSPGVEIVVGCDAGKVYAFYPGGGLVPGWPTQCGAELYSTPTLADLDLDGDTEVVVSAMDALVRVWDCDGIFAGGGSVEWGTFRGDVWRTGLHGHEPPVDVPEAPTSRTALRLEQNSPNPFNPSTTIRYYLPAPDRRVVLSIHDVAGRLVNRLVDGPVDAGGHSVEWDGRNGDGNRVGSGVYLVRLSTAAGTATTKMVLLK